MRINSITPNTAYLRNNVSNSHSGSAKAREKERELNKQNNSENISTTIKSNPDGRASFKGGAPLLHRAANFASDNPLLAEAIFALAITCGARPITIMATAKNEEDKEKCSYQAMKSIASGLVGLAMTALISTPIKAAVKIAHDKGAFKITPEYREKAKTIVKKGVEALNEFAQNCSESGSNQTLTSQIFKLTENGQINLNIFKEAGKKSEKLFKREIKNAAPNISKTVKEAINAQRTLNNFEKTGKNVMDKFFQPIFMPIRADVTIALVPILLGLLGKHKPGAKAPQVAQNPMLNINHNLFFNENEKVLFESFSGVANHENK